jgi:DCN1-like protein 1/2
MPPRKKSTAAPKPKNAKAAPTKRKAAALAAEPEHDETEEAAHVEPATAPASKRVKAPLSLAAPTLAALRVASAPASARVSLLPVPLFASASTLKPPATLVSTAYSYYGAPVSTAAAFADVAVKGGGGKWFFQFTVKQNAPLLRFGWCTPQAVAASDLAPGDAATSSASSGSSASSASGASVKLGTTAHAWAWDGRSSLYHGAASAVNSAYGKGDVRVGDVFGCGVDFDRCTIEFWRNGTALGVAFRDVTSRAGPLSPIVHLEQRGEVEFNFTAVPAGGEPWCALQLSAAPSKEQAALCAEYLNDGEDGEPPRITADGTLRLAADLAGGAEADESSLMLLAFKFGSSRVWEFSRDEFLGGLVVHRIASLAELKRRLGVWQAELASNDVAFGLLYAFLFDYLKDDPQKTVLLADEAKAVWAALKLEARWPLFAQFLCFFDERAIKSINRDAWRQLLEFARQYRTGIANFNANDSWPLMLDEFVEWLQERKK